MFKLRVPKEEQIKGVLFEDPSKWASKIMRSHWANDDFDGSDLGFEDFVTISEDEIFDAAKEGGFAHFCTHYRIRVPRGDGVSVYENEEGKYVHSSTDRGAEHIFGTYDTLEEAHRSLIKQKIKTARILINARG